MDQNRKAVIFILLAGSLWGIVGIPVRVLSTYGFSPLQMTTIRLASSALILGIFLALTDREKFRIQKQDIKIFLGISVFSILFFNVMYSSTMQLTSLSIAAVLLYTSPIFVMLVSIPVFSEKITAKKLVAVMFSFVGCILVSGAMSDYASLTLKALLYGLLAAMGYATYSILGRVLIKRYHSMTITFYAFAISAVGGLFICNLGEISAAVAARPLGLLIAVLMGISCSFMPYLLYTRALQQIEASKASIIASIEPVVATLAGVLYFGELVTITEVLGIICVLIAILILNR